MNEHQLKRIFPNASRSTIAANRGVVSNPEPQRHEAPTLGATIPGEAKSLRRPRIRFTLFRCQLLDPDNAAGSVKDLLDGLRHSSLIQGDEWHAIKLEVEQEKVSKRKDERTEIVIIPFTQYLGLLKGGGK